MSCKTQSALTSPNLADASISGAELQSANERDPAGVGNSTAWPRALGYIVSCLIKGKEGKAPRFEAELGRGSRCACDKAQCARRPEKVSLSRGLPWLKSNPRIVSELGLSGLTTYIFFSCWSILSCSYFFSDLLSGCCCCIRL